MEQLSNNWTYLGRVSDVLGIVSPFLTLIALSLLNKFKKRVERYKELEVIKKEMELLVEKLSSAKKKSLVPMQMKREILDVITHSKNLFDNEKDKNDEMINLIDVAINKLETEPDCTKASFRIILQRILNTISSEKELTYASK